MIEYIIGCKGSGMTLFMFVNIKKEVKIMAKKGVPKKDGSGKGIRANKGRGGCKKPKSKGKNKR